MAVDLLIGVDIGTQGLKSSVFDMDGVCLATRFIPSKLHQPEPGITEEDPEFQFDSVCRSVSECVGSLGESEKSRISCLAIDGQMAGIIGVGTDGKAVTPYDSWLDTRCAPYIREMKEQAGDEIIRKTGNPPSFNHGPKILWWKEEKPEIYNQIAKFVQPSGYAAMRLCGLKGQDAFIDQTYLHFSGFADNRNRLWDRGLIGTFGIDGDKLPNIVSSTDIVGEMTSEMARRCAMIRPIPVATGCGDTAASFLSCGAVRPGICVDVAGTASVFAATTDRFSYDIATQVMGCGASVTDGLWHPYAYINGGGMNLEWFVTEILGRDKNDKERFADLESEELKPQVSDPIFVPHMAGRVSPSQPDMKGSFAGLSWNHTRTQLFRSVMESVALEYGIYRNSLISMVPDTEITELRITGGGERSLLWNSMKSSVLQVPVFPIDRNHGAPMGAAILAGMATGLFKSTIEAADRWITLKSSIKSDPRLWPFYERRVEKYQSLLDIMNRYYTGDM